MRSSSWWTMLVVVAACGGGQTVSPPGPPPPPPPPPGPPASVAVQGGDGQTAGPGQPVPVNPTVMVRDASNRPLGGIAVTFAPDSVSGSVAQSSATTAADGTASPGAWTLGPVEGDHRLRATVGSLAPASVLAHAVYPTTLLSDATIPASGGTIGFRKPGDPLDGLTLQIPAGAFVHGGHWKIESRPKEAGPKNPNLRAAHPVIVITTDQGLADSGLVLTVPLRVARDSVPVVTGFDLNSGRFEGLPVADWTDTSVTVITRRFGSVLGSGPGASLGESRSFAAGDPRFEVILSILPLEPALAVDAYSKGGVNTEYEPTDDAWEFGNYGSYLTPFGQSTGSALSSIYYYVNRKFADGRGLYGRYARWAYWAGNPLGYRVAALAETDVNWPTTVAAIKKIEGAAISAGKLPDVGHYFSLLGAMALTHRPQVLLTSAAPGVPGFIALVAYKVTPTAVLVANPAEPGKTITIPFVDGKFQPVSISHVTGAPPYTANRFRFAGLSALIEWSKLGDRWAELDAGHVGTAAFPNYTIQYRNEDFGTWEDFPGDDKLSVTWQDVQLRAVCPTCERRLPENLAAIAVFNRAGAKIASDEKTGIVKFRMAGGERQVGVHILGGRAFCTGCQPFFGHLDFRVLDITTSTFYVSPDPAIGLTDKPITLTAKNLGLATPASLRYDWTFTHFSAPQTESVKGDSAVTHIWPVAGTFEASVSVVDLKVARVVGKASATVTVGQAVPAWRFTELKLESATGPGASDPYHLGLLSAELAELDATPAVPSKGVVFFRDAAATIGGQLYRPGVYLQIENSPQGLTAFDPSNPNITIYPLALEPGSAPAAPDFDDDLVLDKATKDGLLDAGTFGGRMVKAVRDMNGFVPGGGGVGVKSMLYYEVEATKSGTALTGTIRRFQNLWEYFGAPGCKCVVFTGVLKHVWSFSARRIQ